MNHLYYKQRCDNIRIVVLSDDPALAAWLQADLTRAGFRVVGFYDPDDALAWEKLQDDSVTRIYLIDHVVRDVSWKTILRRFQQEDLVIDPVLLLPPDDPSTVHQVKCFGAHEVCARKDHDLAMLPEVVDQLARRIAAGRQLKAAHVGLRIKGSPGTEEVTELLNQDKSAFLANVSHEIRNPLGAVIGMAKTLEKTDLDEEQQKYLQSILLSSNNLMLILNDMLDYAKLESRKVDVANTHFAIKEALEEVINLHRRDAAEKNNALNYHVDADVPVFIGTDKLKLQQVLNNLISNAIKFTVDGEVVLVVQLDKAGAQEEMLHFSVKDTGIGVPPDKVPGLFDPLYQLDASSTKEYQGAGQGLSIAKGLVELLGGRFYFESQSGQGSLADFSIPITWDQSPKVADADKGAYDAPRDSLKVLIAEDDAINQMYLAGLLRSLGWEVDTAYNGKMALEKFQNTRYDIVLMDVQMPRMDGFEATRKIRELEASQGGKTPVLAITGYAIPGDQERFFEAGMDACLSKPIDETELLDTIRALASGGNKKS